MTPMARRDALAIGYMLSRHARAGSPGFGVKRNTIGMGCGVAVALAVAWAVIYPNLRGGYRLGSPEVDARGDIRILQSAEAAYQSANVGFYDKPECLHRPGECIPGYAGPTFLDDTRLQLRRSRYQREFHPGPAPSKLPVGASSSSLVAYAYVAIPDPYKDGLPYGTRSFCGDFTGGICATVGPGRPTVAGGTCVVAPGSPPSSVSRWVRDLFQDPPVVEPCYKLP